MELNYRGKRYQQQSPIVPSQASTWNQKYRGHEIVQDPSSVQNLDKGAESFEQLTQMGVSCYQAERYDEALGYFNQALRTYAYDPSVWAMRSECFVQLKQYEEAIASIDQAIQLDPQNFEFQRDRQLLIAIYGMQTNKF